MDNSLFITDVDELEQEREILAKIRTRKAICDAMQTMEYQINSNRVSNAVSLLRICRLLVSAPTGSLVKCAAQSWLNCIRGPARNTTPPSSRRSSLLEARA